MVKQKNLLNGLMGIKLSRNITMETKHQVVAFRSPLEAISFFKRLKIDKKLSDWDKTNVKALFKTFRIWHGRGWDAIVAIRFPGHELVMRGSCDNVDITLNLNGIERTRLDLMAM